MDVRSSPHNKISHHLFDGIYLVLSENVRTGTQKFLGVLKHRSREVRAYLDRGCVVSVHFVAQYIDVFNPTNPLAIFHSGRRCHANPYYSSVCPETCVQL